MSCYVHVTPSLTPHACLYAEASAVTSPVMHTDPSDTVTALSRSSRSMLRDHDVTLKTTNALALVYCTTTNEADLTPTSTVGATHYSGMGGSTGPLSVTTAAYNPPARRYTAVNRPRLIARHLFWWRAFARAVFLKNTDTDSNYVLSDGTLDEGWSSGRLRNAGKVVQSHNSID